MISDESTISSSAPSTNSTGTLTGSSSGKGTTTEGESDYYNEMADMDHMGHMDAHNSAYSLESTAAPALTAPVMGNAMTPDATTQVPGGSDIEPTSIQTLAELQQRLAQVPSDQLVVLYFQATSITSRLLGQALIGLKNTFGLEIITFDLERHSEIASSYNISQAPTFVFVKNSEKLEQFSGGDINKLKSVIGPLIKK